MNKIFYLIIKLIYLNINLVEKPKMENYHFLFIQKKKVLKIYQIKLTNIIVIIYLNMRKEMPEFCCLLEKHEIENL
jgi:hypothetical protein